MTIGIYIRVSSKDQNYKAQLHEITRWLSLNMRGSAVSIFEDKQTGRNTQRDGFQALQRAIFAGEVKMVVVWKIDRLARSMRDGINVVYDWMERDVRLVSVTQQIDLSGAAGRAMLMMLLAFAEMELETSKERQAVGIQQAKAQGKYKGRKLGTKKKKPARARELLERGNSLDEIAAALGVSRRTVYRYLKEST